MIMAPPPAHVPRFPRFPRRQSRQSCGGSGDAYDNNDDGPATFAARKRDKSATSWYDGPSPRALSTRLSTASSSCDGEGDDDDNKNEDEDEDEDRRRWMLDIADSTRSLDRYRQRATLRR